MRDDVVQPVAVDVTKGNLPLPFLVGSNWSTREMNRRRINLGQIERRRAEDRYGNRTFGFQIQRIGGFAGLQVHSHLNCIGQLSNRREVGNAKEQPKLA